MRTTVFLKGCSLRCKWCSNPESIHPKPELAYNLSNKCIGKDQCGLCLKAKCPESATSMLGIPTPTKVRINWDLWIELRQCWCRGVSAPGALPLWAEEMSVDQVLDGGGAGQQSFYRESGGGITLIGGECQLQADFAAALLAGAHQRGINTAIETASNVPGVLGQKGSAARRYLAFTNIKLTDPGAP